MKLKIIKNYWLMLVIMSFSVFSAQCQVGINTIDPQESLDVNGTTRIRDLTKTSATSTQLLGSDTDGTLAGVTVGTNLELTNGVLNATGGGAEGFLKVAYITDNFNASQNNNYDLDLSGANSDKTVFVLDDTSAGQSIFTGFSGGTDGRLIIITSYTQNFNIGLVDNSTNSLAQNQIEFSNSSGGTANINSYGSFTLIYLAVDQKWHIVNKMTNP